MTTAKAPDAEPATRAKTANRFLTRLHAARSRPMVVAHRGDSSHAPENTILAARLGHKTGADAWEFDVQVTRDGITVVIHDGSLIRTTDVVERFPDDPRAGAGYRVSDFDYEEVRSLDAGAWFLEPKGGHRTAEAFGTRDRIDGETLDRIAAGEVRVPSLRECLDLTARLDWLANVEIKSFPGADPRLLPAVRGEIEAGGVADRVLLSSFDHDDLASPMSHLPVATGALTTTPLHRPERYVREVIGADCYHPSAHALGAASERYLKSPGPEHLRAGDLAALKARGVPVLVYTVNDPRPGGLAEHLARAGASGLFTDVPGGLLRLFA